MFLGSSFNFYDGTAIYNEFISKKFNLLINLTVNGFLRYIFYTDRAKSPTSSPPANNFDNAIYYSQTSGNNPSNLAEIILTKLKILL